MAEATWRDACHRTGQECRRRATPAGIADPAPIPALRAPSSALRASGAARLVPDEPRAGNVRLWLSRLAMEPGNCGAVPWPWWSMLPLSAQHAVQRRGSILAVPRPLQLLVMRRLCMPAPCERPEHPIEASCVSHAEECASQGNHGARDVPCASETHCKEREIGDVGARNSERWYRCECTQGTS